MSGHNTCVACGEYCAEDSMICVNCRSKVSDIHSNPYMDVHIVGNYDGRVSVIDRGEVMGIYSSVLEALAELLRRYGRDPVRGSKIIHKMSYYRDRKLKEETEFPTFRKEAISAAKDLCYPASVVDALKGAVSTEQVNRIMNRARAEWIRKDDIEATFRGKKGKK